MVAITAPRLFCTPVPMRERDRRQQFVGLRDGCGPDVDAFTHALALTALVDSKRCLACRGHNLGWKVKTDGAHTLAWVECRDCGHSEPITERVGK